MLTIEKTEDMDIVKQIMTHPKIYPNISDDYSVSADKFVPPENKNIWYLLVKNDGVSVGLFLGVPKNSVCMEVHHYLLPELWGKQTLKAAQMALNYLWEHSMCQCVIGFTPLYNKLAVRYAIGVGFTLLGNLPSSYLKNNELWAQAIFYMERPEGR